MLKYFISIAMAMALPLNFVSAAEKAKTTKKSKATIKKPKHPMSAKDRAAFGKPLPLLKFDQVAKLAHSQRVKYVRELRRSFIEIEKTQNMYKRLSTASLIDPNLQKKNELYAFLFGQFAEAQDTQKRGGNNYSGGPNTDQCIYAFNLNRYPPGARDQLQKFNCPPTRCTTMSGARCGEEISGFGLNGKEECIDNSNAWRSTAACDDRRQELIGRTDSNGNIIAPTAQMQKITNDLIPRVDNYFKFNQPGATLKRSDLTSDEAISLIKELANNAWSDEAYAELILVLSFLKNNGINQIDDAQLGKLYSKIQPSQFGANFDELSKSVNAIFGEYINHCDSTVDPIVIEDLKQNVHLLSRSDSENSKQMGAAAWTQEKRRLCAVSAYTQATGGNMQLPEGANCPTYSQVPGSNPLAVRNITEIEECRLIQKRKDGLSDKLSKINSTYPATADDTPAGEQPPVVLPKPQFEQPAGIHTGAEQVATGCSRNITSDEHKLFMPAARCMICQAEKSADKFYGANYIPDAQNQTSGTTYPKRYAVSTKWTSLLSTMALACGNAPLNGTVVTPEVMLEYMQTFGHCDSDTYDWDPTENLSPKDRQLVEKWSNDSFWKGNADSIKGYIWGGEPVETDKEFSRIYGVSYTEATEIFCDPNRFEKGLFNKKYRKYKEDYKTPSAYDRMRFGRAQFQHKLSSSNNVHNRLRFANENSTDNSLLKCMRESLKNTKNLYTGGNERNTCVQFVEFNGSPNWDLQYKNMLQDVFRVNYEAKERPSKELATGYINSTAGTTTFAQGSTCYVAKQWEASYKRDGNNYAYDANGNLQANTYTVDLVDPSIGGKGDTMISLFTNLDGSQYPTPARNYMTDTSDPLLGLSTVNASFTAPTAASCGPYNDLPPVDKVVDGWKFEKSSGSKFWSWGGKK